jgi:hypothetical protein
MDTAKLFVAGLLGGVINFFLGWLVWGILLMDYFSSHTTNPQVARSSENMVFWALIGGNLVFGFLHAYILYKANVKTPASGAILAATISALVTLGSNLMMYAQSDLLQLSIVLPDVLASAVVSAIVGATIGWYYGRGPLNKTV